MFGVVNGYIINLHFLNCCAAGASTGLRMVGRRAINNGRYFTVFIELIKYKYSQHLRNFYSAEPYLTCDDFSIQNTPVCFVARRIYRMSETIHTSLLSRKQSIKKKKFQTKVVGF